MADTVKMQDTVAYDDEMIAAKEAEEKKAAILADAAKPFDPDALLEVRHLSMFSNTILMSEISATLVSIVMVSA